MNSRIPGFYKDNLALRRKKLEQALETPAFDWSRLSSDALSEELASSMIENVIGSYTLPFAVAINLQMNGEDRIVPMVIEEPSVVAACSNAAKMIREGGGFQASFKEHLSTCQIELREISDHDAAATAIHEAKESLLSAAGQSVPNLLQRGGGPRDIEYRRLSDDRAVVHLYADCGDAMGANLVNTMAEAIGQNLAELAKAKLGLKILSNLCDRRVVEVFAKVPLQALAVGLPAELAADLPALGRAMEEASRFAELDPYRAATHNKGIMNGTDAVVMATGNDWRAVEAAAHAFAALTGHYAPLSTWRHEGEFVIGQLKMPIALGTVGGTLRVHPGAKAALDIAKITSAADLECLAASAGLASNLAALRALATEGIQRGHMSMHARSIALAVGATGDEIEKVADGMRQSKSFRAETAKEILEKLRHES